MHITTTHKPPFEMGVAFFSTDVAPLQRNLAFGKLHIPPSLLGLLCALSGNEPPHGIDIYPVLHFSAVALTLAPWCNSSITFSLYIIIRMSRKCKHTRGEDVCANMWRIQHNRQIFFVSTGLLEQKYRVVPSIEHTNICVFAHVIVVCKGRGVGVRDAVKCLAIFVQWFWGINTFINCTIKRKYILLKTSVSDTIW